MTWPWSRPAREVPAYVDTPVGLLSADGTHYRTTEPLLREYAGPVVDAVGLPTLLRLAGAWLRSPLTLAVLVLPVLLMVLPWWAALLMAVLLYALWSAVAPGAVWRVAARAFSILEQPVVQGLVYIGVLSAFAAMGRYAAVWAGMAGFIAFRLGLVGALLRPVVDAMHRSLYALPPADQTLRALLIREAIRRGITLPGLETIEDRVRAFWQREKR